MREIWGWGVLLAGAVAGCFLLIDAGFFLANLTKVAQGGYVPLAIAILVYLVMWTWHRGATAVGVRLQEALVPVPQFLAKVEADHIPRVPGTAVFLTRTQQDTPTLMVWHVEHNRALHRKLFVLRVVILQVPWAAARERIAFAEEAPNFWRAEARYGFMERPDIPELLRESAALGCSIDLHDVNYYVNHVSVVRRDRHPAMPLWQHELFTVMDRNAAHVGDVFSLPSDQVVEIGRQIPI
jgi:KUP system potassium uptake protein